MCDADVCVGVRIRETGQVHILSRRCFGILGFPYFTAYMLLNLQLVKKKADLSGLPLPNSKFDYSAGPGKDWMRR